jgi:hypothetical protein
MPQRHVIRNQGSFVAAYRLAALVRLAAGERVRLAPHFRVRLSSTNSQPFSIHLKPQQFAAVSILAVSAQMLAGGELLSNLAGMFLFLPCPSFITTQK